jgi:L-ribulose-5-phosphate 3-epimerase
MHEPTFPPDIVLSGLADEAADDIETQIKAHLELGWTSLELRLIDGRMVTADLSEPAFAHALSRIEQAGLSVAGFASAIGNWSRPIDGDFAIDIRELQSGAMRMRRARTRFVRTMSWTRGGASESAWRDEAIRRYRILAQMAQELDVVLLHENCAGWAGQSAAHMGELLDAVGSPNVGVLFDIGNTISHGYEPWAFYQGVKDRIRYVHVKDCRRNPAGGRSGDYAYPGEGDAMVREILADLLGSGYRGTISIEPHIASVIHLGGRQDPGTRYASYIEYARRVEGIIADVGRTPDPQVTPSA